jgi:putative transposase
MDVLAGTDFFTVEVLTWRGLVTYYVLFFLHLDSRGVSIAGITDRPEACWMRQVACNATLEGMGHLNGCRYVLHGSRRQSLTSSKIPLVSSRFLMPTERWPLRSKLRQSADG